MNSKIALWFIFVSVLGLSGCHKNRTPRNAGGSADSSVFDPNPNKIEATATGEFVEPVKIRDIAFDYLTAKSKFSFDGKTQNFENTNVNIRIKKDSIIWISVTGIGLEVARGLITPDSIVFMDKIHKDYFVFTYAQLSRQYNFDLNFSLLQSIIVGNLPFPEQPDARFEKLDDVFLLRQKQDRINVENYIGETNFKLIGLKAWQSGTNNSFLLNYEEFKEISGSEFPFSSTVKLNVVSPKDQKFSETSVRLKHSKVEITGQNPGFPFSIPASYSKKR